MPGRTAVSGTSRRAGSYEVRGKTLGIVGYGHIGTQVGVLAEALGMRVVYYDVVTKLALGNAQPVRSLDALLGSADVVTLHVPETPQTQNLIGPDQLRLMKPGAHLINASRGTVVDIDALAEALRSGHLGGAAVDVFPQEPESNSDEFQSALRGLDNVLLTPHIGGSTAEAQEAIGVEVAEKLLTYSNNGSTLSAVNFPEVALPGASGQAPRAAHPPQPAGHAVARQRRVLRAADQRRGAVPADQSAHRLCRHRHRPGSGCRLAGPASRTRVAGRHHQGAPAVLRRTRLDARRYRPRTRRGRSPHIPSASSGNGMRAKT